MRIKLTKNELYYIDDKLTLNFSSESEGLRSKSNDALIAVDKNLLKKISKAITSKRDSVIIELEEVEVWILRELASTNLGGPRQGIALKEKIARIIVQMDRKPRVRKVSNQKVQDYLNNVKMYSEESNANKDNSKDNPRD